MLTLLVTLPPLRRQKASLPTTGWAGILPRCTLLVGLPSRKVAHRGLNTAPHQPKQLPRKADRMAPEGP